MKIFTLIFAINANSKRKKNTSKDMPVDIVTRHFIEKD